MEQPRSCAASAFVNNSGSICAAVPGADWIVFIVSHHSRLFSTRASCVMTIRKKHAEKGGQRWGEKRINENYSRSMANR
jgi:hypothetical protein